MIFLINTKQMREKIVLSTGKKATDAKTALLNGALVDNIESLKSVEEEKKIMMVSKRLDSKKILFLK